jgi:gamma-glutamylcyclotransferase (GGCT)/AIG2-like uncharacterized protein YtfP
MPSRPHSAAHLTVVPHMPLPLAAQFPSADTQALRRMFVYGTLMSTAGGAYGQAARSRLKREAPERQAAVIRGRLFELGRYPGLIDSAEARDDVHGQLLELTDPAATMTWLDEYEAISTDPEADNEYARVVRSVRLSDGTAVTAWVYLYQKPVTGLIRVASGRWLARPANDLAD